MQFDAIIQDHFINGTEILKGELTQEMRNALFSFKLTWMINFIVQEDEFVFADTGKQNGFKVTLEVLLEKLIQMIIQDITVPTSHAFFHGHGNQCGTQTAWIVQIKANG